MYLLVNKIGTVEVYHQFDHKWFDLIKDPFFRIIRFYEDRYSELRFNGEWNPLEYKG